MSYFVYILSNRPNGTLYIGVTNDLIRRVHEHREGLIEGFTKRYHVTKLVYFESSENIYSALQREKTLKHWLREWKIALITKHNPNWKDLWQDIQS